MRYPQRRERIFLAGFEAVQKKREKLCASGKLPFAWLRVDNCLERTLPGDTPVQPIQHAAHASRLFHSSLPFAGRGREAAMVMCLNAANVPLGVAIVGQGGRDAAILDTAIVFQPALLLGALGIIFAHNHPSGRLEPSRDDIELTKRLVEAGKILSTPLLDSLVLSDDPDAYFSLLERGMM